MRLWTLHPRYLDRQGLLALVVMDHALRHRAQCGDVRYPIEPIPPQA